VNTPYQIQLRLEETSNVCWSLGCTTRRVLGSHVCEAHRNSSRHSWGSDCSSCGTPRYFGEYAACKECLPKVKAGLEAEQSILRQQELSRLSLQLVSETADKHGYFIRLNLENLCWELCCRTLRILGSNFCSEHTEEWNHKRLRPECIGGTCTVHGGSCGDTTAAGRLLGLESCAAGIEALKEAFRRELDLLAQNKKHRKAEARRGDPTHDPKTALGTVIVADYSGLELQTVAAHTENIPAVDARLAVDALHVPHRVMIDAFYPCCGDLYHYEFTCWGADNRKDSGICGCGVEWGIVFIKDYTSCLHRVHFLEIGAGRFK